MDVAIKLYEEVSMMPTDGLVFYTDENGRSMATLHDVVTAQEGWPELGGSRPLSRGELQDLVKKLIQETERRRYVLPECILAADRELVAWWRPAQHRSVFFDTKVKGLDGISGRMALHPALVFIGGVRSLKVYALRESKRPTDTTELCQAPYWNVYGAGSMCVGSAPIPVNPQPTDECLDQYETAFFDSSFTHTNLGSKDLINYPGGHNGFWKSMVASDHTFFPAWSLLPVVSAGPRGLTLAEALKK